jgi:hypothetical protein
LARAGDVPDEEEVASRERGREALWEEEWPGRAGGVDVVEAAPEATDEEDENDRGPEEEEEGLSRLLADRSSLARRSPFLASRFLIVAWASAEERLN